MALLLTAAGCGASGPAPARTNAAGYRLTELAGGEMLEIPAGEFRLDGRLLYLPTFWIEVEPGPPTPGLVPADEAHLAKAGLARYGLPPRAGTRHVRDAPPAGTSGVAWRPDFWEAIAEARRRNAIVFVTLHWDGCGNCDRFGSKIARDPRFVAYVNEHVVPLVGVTNQEGIEPHASLPDGRCWIHPGLTCEQHRAVFEWGLDATMWFPMSPGHAILTPHVGPAPTREEFVMAPDERLPDEGTVEGWIAQFRACQEKLGAAVPWSEYRQRPRPSGTADPAELERISAERAAWRQLVEARRYVRDGDADGARVLYRRVIEGFPGSGARAAAEREMP